MSYDEIVLKIAEDLPEDARSSFLETVLSDFPAHCQRMAVRFQKVSESKEMLVLRKELEVELRRVNERFEPGALRVRAEAMARMRYDALGLHTIGANYDR